MNQSNDVHVPFAIIPTDMPGIDELLTSLTCDGVRVVLTHGKECQRGKPDTKYRVAVVMLPENSTAIRADVAHYLRSNGIHTFTLVEADHGKSPLVYQMNLTDDTSGVFECGHFAGLLRPVALRWVANAVFLNNTYFSTE